MEERLSADHLAPRVIDLSISNEALHGLFEFVGQFEESEELCRHLRQEIDETDSELVDMVHELVEQWGISSDIEQDRFQEGGLLAYKALLYQAGLSLGQHSLLLASPDVHEPLADQQDIRWRGRENDYLNEMGSFHLENNLPFLEFLFEYAEGRGYSRENNELTYLLFGSFAVYELFYQHYAMNATIDYAFGVNSEH